MALAIALLCSAGAWAQTDVTSTYMTNPSFEAANATTGDISATGVFTNDWNITSISYARVAVFNSSSTISTFGGTSSVSNGNYYLMIRSNLDQGKTQNIRQNSDMALPKGKYSIYFDYKAARVKNVARKFTISAINSGGSTTYGSKAIEIPQQGASSTYFSGIDWSTASFEFTHENTTNTRINISCETQGTANSSSSQHTVVLLDNFVIKYSNINGSTLALLIAQATAINGKLGTLTSEIATAQGVYDGINDTPAYQETIDNAISTLQSAINTKVAAYSFDPAGDDVTSFIFRPGFEGMTPESANYGTAKGKDYSSEGWTMVETGDFGYGAIMSYGSDKTFNSASVPATDNAGNTGNTLGVSVGWGSTQRYQSEVITLPAGSYRLSVKAYNANAGAQQFTSKVGFVPTSGESSLSSKTSFTSNTWETDEIDFVLDNDTEGRFQIGGTAVSGGSGDNAKIFFDNISLTYFAPLKLAQIQWQAVHDALADLDATLLPDAAEAAITTELAKAVPTTTVNEVNTAKAALQALIDSYDGIKAAYEKLSALIDLTNSEKENSTGDKTDFAAAISTATDNIETRTAADVLTNDYNTLEEARETYVTGGAQPTAGHVFDFTFKINDAAVTGTSAWGTARTGSGAQYIGAPDNTYLDIGWAQTYNMNQNVASLPAGSYTLKAATRAKSSEVTEANIYVNQTNSALNKSTNNHRDNNTGGELGNGWSWSNVDFVVLEAGAVTVGFYGQTTGQGWAGADDFHLYYKGTAPMYKEALLDAITSANTLYNSGANVGTGVFQIPESAGTDLDNAISDANDVYEDDDATADEITEAITALQTAINTFNAAELNAPAAGARYYLKVATSGHAKANKAIVVSLGATSANNPTGYSFAANASPAAHIAGAYIFTPVPEKANTYYISVVRPEGTVYLTYGSLNGSAAGWNTQQIQGTTNAENKGEFKIVATSTANVFNIVNTVFDGADNYIDCQDNGPLYTDTNIDKKDFSLAEASQANVSVNLTAGKYGTRIFPFTPTLPDGVKAYSCEASSGSTLTLVEVVEPAANTPYILYSEGGYSGEALTGWGTATTDSYTTGWLTGVYTSTAVPTNSYVLQTLNEKQAFYLVSSEDPISAPAYRAYLTVPDAGVKAFYFDFNDATAISETLAPTGRAGEGPIYNLAGQKMSKLQKGVNIVNGKKVLVK